MDVRNIMILYNGLQFTREEIIEDLKAEGYKHNFIFGNKIKPDYIYDYMRKIEEVWCFGDCKEMILYEIAKDKGMDIWEMG